MKRLGYLKSIATFVEPKINYYKASNCKVARLFKGFFYALLNRYYGCIISVFIFRACSFNDWFLAKHGDVQPFFCTILPTAKNQSL